MTSPPQEEAPPDPNHPGVSGQLINDLMNQHERWLSAEIGDASFAASYFLLWQMERHGRRFASRISRTHPQPGLEKWRAMLLDLKGRELEAALQEYLMPYQFLHIIPSVPAALTGWIKNDWPLQLLTHIPSPHDVLTMQSRGTRPVTVICNFPRATRPVLAKADAFEFLVHDLEHAWKFCNDPAQHKAQTTLFRLLADAVTARIFHPWLQDPIFAEKFDYLISDMNTHPVHGLRFLHAVLIECLLRQENKGMRDQLAMPSQRTIKELMHRLSELWRLPDPAAAALSNLAEGRFDQEKDARAIEQALMAH